MKRNRVAVAAPGEQIPSVVCKGCNMLVAVVVAHRINAPAESMVCLGSENKPNVRWPLFLAQWGQIAWWLLRLAFALKKYPECPSAPPRPSMRRLPRQCQETPILLLAW